MPTYVHECKDCELVWEDTYSFAKFDEMKERGETLSCPECGSMKTQRQMQRTRVVFAPGGVGWADNGYYEFEAYDKHKAEGKSVTRYDRKEDLQRDLRGEAEQAETARLKKVDEAAKRHLSPDAALTQQEADVKIKAAGQRAVDR